MKIEFTLTGKHLAAAAAVFLGVVLALAGTIVRGVGSAPANTSGIVETIVQERDHVTAGELARWIVEKRTDFELIDLRQPWQYADYHIPTATNVPLPQLFQEDGLKKLSREKKVVVYGLGAGHAAQAQLLLSMKGYNALSLREGISSWWEDVMTPLSLRSGNPSPEGYQQAKQLRDFFLGSAPPAGAAAAPPVVAPPVEAPPAKPQAPSPSNRLKLGRGCS